MIGHPHKMARVARKGARAADAATAPTGPAHNGIVRITFAPSSQSRGGAPATSGSGAPGPSGNGAPGPGGSGAPGAPGDDSDDTMPPPTSFDHLGDVAEAASVG